MNKNQFNIAMSVLMKAFPEKNMDLDILWMFLRDLEVKQLENAIIKVISCNQEIYKSTNLIALLRDNAFDWKHKNMAEAWEEVTMIIKNTPRDQIPVYSSPIIKRAVDSIGLYCMRTSENISIERSHFFRIYESMLSKEKENYKVPRIEREKDNKCSIADGKVDELVNRLTNKMGVS